MVLLNQLVLAQTEKPQWVNVSPFADDYNGLIDGFFLNANEGWIWQWNRNKSNKLYYTSDGAETFKTIHTLIDSTIGFKWIQMLNSKTGYSKTGIFDSVDKLLKTIDGGITWTEVKVDTAYLNLSTYAIGMPFYFIDTLTGFASQYIHNHGMEIFKTYDGGKTWNKTNLTCLENTEIKQIDLGGITQFFFYDKNNGWAGCTNGFDASVLLKTTDGGLTWELAIPYGTDFFGIHFISPFKGGAVGRNSIFSNVFLTDNNFETFSYENQAWDYEMYQYAKAIAYQNDSIIWISGNPALIYRSTDSGKIFQKFQFLDNEEHSSYVDKISFFGNTGYAMGFCTLYKFQDTLVLSANEQKFNNRNSIKIHPNPANNKACIELPNSFIGEILIYDTHGRIVINNKIQNQNKLSIDSRNLKNGVYLVVLVDNTNKHYQQKLVILN